MPQVTLSVRMDEDIKRMFDSFCAEVGMNASVAVNLFVRTVVREQRIPFEIAIDPVERALDEADREAAADPRRLSHEEVFSKARAQINGL